MAITNIPGKSAVTVVLVDTAVQIRANGRDGHGKGNGVGEEKYGKAPSKQGEVAAEVSRKRRRIVPKTGC